MLSQAIEQLSSSEDEEQPSDSVTGVYFYSSFPLFKSFLMHLFPNKYSVTTKNINLYYNLFQNHPS